MGNTLFPPDDTRSAILLNKHQILTVARRGIARGSAIRVTPTLYNTAAELDRLVRALHVESAAFL